MSTHEITTATAIGRFRKELLEQGFSTEEAFALSRDALDALLRGDEVVVAGKTEVSA